DDGLVGKRRHKLDLLCCKWLHHGSVHSHHANDTTLPKKWDSDDCTVAAELLGFVPSVFRIGQDVWNVNDSALECRSPNDTTSIHSKWMLFKPFLKFVRNAIACGNTVVFAFA